VKRGVRSWLMRHSHPGNRTSQGMDPTEIYAPHGSFIIFSREYFERGGSLKPGAFLYAEELFVAETCRRLGLKAVYWPVIQVAHDEHVSTAANPAVRHFMATAADYCYKEFFAKVKA